MALAVIGAGFGRTGTESMKLALEMLGLGPCHHMKEVLADPTRLPDLHHDEDFPGRHRCVSAHRFRDFKLTGHLAVRRRLENNDDGTEVSGRGWGC